MHHDEAVEANKGRVALSVFDDLEYEGRSTERWLATGTDPETGVMSLPAKAYFVFEQEPVPADQGEGPGSTGGGTWARCDAVGYEESTNSWRVKFHDNDEPRTLHRLFVMFLAESPENFANRIKAAHDARESAEACMSFEMVIDCMPVANLGMLNTESQSRLTENAQPRGKRRGKPDTQTLLNEAQTSFQRSMNKITLLASIAGREEASKAKADKGSPQTKGKSVDRSQQSSYVSKYLGQAG